MEYNITDLPLIVSGSVVEIKMDGSIIAKSNEAKFADNREDALKYLGSAERIGNDVLIADSINKRAIILNGNNEIIWEYDSDRYVVDFHLVPRERKTFEVRDDAVSPGIMELKAGSLVIWENNSSQPISIYSGKTTYEQFMLDPDLDLYGEEFKSGVLQPGDRFIYRFVAAKIYDWFVYPTILTGELNVYTSRVSTEDRYVITESDNYESPFTSRVIKVDSWGNVLWTYGEGFLVKPRDARPLLDEKVLIST